MQTSPIEWTDATWNPVTGCTKVSQGCKNCYAEKLYERFNGKGSFSHVQCHPERLYQPGKIRKPSRIFVNSMSDLFHEDVPFSFIRQVLDVIYNKPTHTFQVLTKRPQRMVDFFKWLNNSNLAANFPNLWLGVSVEDQAAADYRIPLLLQVPAAVRFLSCEPLLGQLNLTSYFNHVMGPPTGYIQWVIAGGESGPKARPMHPDWVRILRDQCAAADVPFFFKQWGEYLPYCQGNCEIAETSRIREFQSPHNPEKMNRYFRAGKKAAGRLLDGKEHNEFPNLNHQS